MKSFIIFAILVTSLGSSISSASGRSFVLISSTDSLEDILTKCRDLFRLNTKLGEQILKRAEDPKIKRLGRLIIADNKVTLEVIKDFAQEKQIEIDDPASLSRLKNPALMNYFRAINSLSSSEGSEFESRALGFIALDLTNFTNELRVAGIQTQGTETEKALSKISGVFSQHSSLASLLDHKKKEAL